MAFDETGVANAQNILQEIVELGTLRKRARLTVGDANSAILTDAERDAIRLRWIDRMNTLRIAMRQEVATWT